MSVNGRLRKLEAAVGVAGRVTATLYEHDRGRPDAVEVRAAGTVRRMSREEFRRRHPGALLVFVRCYCEACPSGHGEATEGTAW
jgi:hypothetical protein